MSIILDKIKNLGVGHRSICNGGSYEIQFLQED